MAYWRLRAIATGLVGRVGVDSATLAITGPSNLDGESVKATDTEPYAVNCLGRGVRALIEALRGANATRGGVPISGGR